MARKSLETVIGRRFKDRRLLARALTHPSGTHERGGDRTEETYERLEFLGDSLLGFLVAERLARSDPRADEGLLTRRKQTVVSQGALAAVSRELGLGAAVHLGRGEEATGGREKPSILADVFESVLAAVYLDGGIRAARAFVSRHLEAAIAAAESRTADVTDTKTALQEAVQAHLRRTPRYRIVETAGPAHARRFTAEVMIDDRVAGRGVGASRKAAERAAASAALREWTGREGDSS
jgi:ribonuclease-3